ncbi:MAG: hypothetical protein ACKOWJ_02595 [Micrococcales bacterium]
MTSKVFAYVMGLLTLMYCYLLGAQALAMIATGIPVGVLMGVLLLVFPALAIALTIREFIFGSKVERLGRLVETAGQWPVFDLVVRPSGRPTKDSAAAEFERRKLIVEANPDDYLSWFALGLAYDAAGDRRRARAAMRKALKLHEAELAAK